MINGFYKNINKLLKKKMSKFIIDDKEISSDDSDKEYSDEENYDQEESYDQENSNEEN